MGLFELQISEQNLINEIGHFVVILRFKRKIVT